MQSNKTSSKKTRKVKEEVVATPEVKSAAPEVSSKPRTKRSSTMSPNETAEPTATKHHRRTATKPAPDAVAAPVKESVPVAAKPVTPEVVKPVIAKAVIAPVEEPTGSVQTTEAPEVKSEPTAVKQTEAQRIAVTYDDIAQLAHSYYVARGDQHGDPNEDWLRAERELMAR